jgi:hypothetical protein
LELLRQRTGIFLKQLQVKASQSKRSADKYIYPGTAEDNLFQSDYEHLRTRKRKLSDYQGMNDDTYEGPLESSCRQAGCNEDFLVPRQRLVLKQALKSDKAEEVQTPEIHIGPIASGDTVMKSGKYRDTIAKDGVVVAFEMKAAGVLEELPCCIVVKGVCDNADSHKTKPWQPFSAATASSTMKALLEHLPRDNSVPPAFMGVGKKYTYTCLRDRTL